MWIIFNFGMPERAYDLAVRSRGIWQPATTRRKRPAVRRRPRRITYVKTGLFRVAQLGLAGGAGFVQPLGRRQVGRALEASGVAFQGGLGQGTQHGDEAVEIV